MRRFVVPAAAAAFTLALAFGGPASALDESAPGMLDLGVDIQPRPAVRPKPSSNFSRSFRRMATGRS